MRKHLFKRLIAGALACLMLGTVLPSGSDFTGLFGGSDIAASAENAKYTLVYDAGDGSGTMKSETVIENQEYMFPNSTLVPPEDMAFSYWEMSGTDGIYFPGDTLLIASNCTFDGIITVLAHWKDKEKCGDNAYWEIVDSDSDGTKDKLIINGTGAICNFDDKAPWYDIKDTIKEIVIDEGITTIGQRAFEECTALENVTLPEGLTTISPQAFQNCKALKTIKIPDSVNNISNAFNGSTNLESIYFTSADPSQLHWTTSNDEFKPNKGTKCYVPKGSLDAYKTKFSSNNVNFVVEPCKVTVKTSGSGSVILSAPTVRRTTWKDTQTLVILGNTVKNYDQTINAVKGDTVELSINAYFTGSTSLQLFESDSDWNKATELKKVTSSPYEIKITKSFEYNGQSTSVYRFIDYAAGMHRSYEGRYTLTINWSDPTDTLTANAGDEVNISSNPGDHYILKSLTAKDSASNPVAVKDSKFIMPDNDVMVTATFEKEKHTIKFVDDDGKTVLQSSQVAYGDTPKYTGAVPTKKSTDIFKYTFKGWNKKIAAVTGNTTYKAVYESKRIGLETTRLAGANRFLTAVEISKAGFEKADTAVLAYGLNYADALAGVPLAASLNAPILLTYTNTLDSATLEELGRLKAKKVIILGGTGAINEDVEAELKRNGFETERVAGMNRFGTATAAAEKLNEAPEEVFFVYGLNYADALSVSAAAALKKAPIIYLTTKGELNADTAAYLAKLKEKGSVKTAYYIGGTGVISDDMMKNANKALGIKAGSSQRIAGSNRFLTCVEINKAFADVLTGNTICAATGSNFPDALAGGVFAAQKKAPLFLASGKLSDEQKAYLKTKAAENLVVFGGTGAVPDDLVQSIIQSSI